MDFQATYDRSNYLRWFKASFMPDDFSAKTETVSFSFSAKYIQKALLLGKSESLDLPVYEIHHHSENDPRVSLAKETFHLLAEYLVRNALVIFVSTNSENYRLSYISIDLKILDGKIQKEFTNPRRYSFFLGPNCKIHTPSEFLIKKGRIINLGDLQERFSVEVVNKEFYNEIAILFTKLVGGSRKIGSMTFDEKGLLQLPSLPNNEQNHQKYQEFAVRLLGRLVFCWFLKKKSSTSGVSLISEDLLSSQSVRENEHYYHNILEHLFFQVLNTPQDKRNEVVKDRFQDTPFLNGGLFEPHEDDYYNPDPVMHITRYLNNLIIPDIWFLELFTIFETYNFTIDENTTIDIELSIDPEMLGRIFENLLAEINPETGETARKSTGSYYTPRPIVAYMVDESLKQYLKSKTGLNDDILNPLLSYSEDIEMRADDRLSIIQALDEIKVLDPACGSGAFPMGILQKMLLILQKVDPKAEEVRRRLLESIPDPILKNIIKIKLENNHALWDYSRKLSIIQKSIYGIDIQSIAVEISKLRFFLSLVVDEQVDDKDNNRGIEALPNLEFKFVAANTLITLPKTGTYTFEESSSDLKRLKELRAEYFSSYGEQKKAIESSFKKLQNEIAKTAIGWGRTDSLSFLLSTWDPFSHNAADFFDPEWIFGIITGFDIVIGNPPYLRVQGIQKTQSQFMPYYQKRYQSAKGSFDLYALFIERGFELLNLTGHLAYIVPHKFFQARFGEALRTFLADRKALKQIMRFGSLQLFDEATTYTCLLFLSATSQETFELFEVQSLIDGENVLAAARRKILHPAYDFATIPAPDKNKQSQDWVFSLGNDNRILTRIRYHHTKLDDLVCKIFQGLATSADKIYVLEIIQERENSVICYSKSLDQEIEIERGIVKPFLMGKDVHRYERLQSKHVVIFPYNIGDRKPKLMPIEYIRKNFPKGWNYLLSNKKALAERERGRMNNDQFYAYIYPKNLNEFESKKIMTPEIALGCQMTVDDVGLFYHTTKVYSFKFKPEVKHSINYLLGLLNSKILWYFIVNTGYVLRGGYYTFKTDYLKPFPIAEPSPKQEQTIQRLVEYILYLKTLDEIGNNVNNAEIKVMTAYFEQMIDAIVYEMYLPELFSIDGMKPSSIISLDLFPKLENINTQKTKMLLDIFKQLYDTNHPVRKHLFFLDSIETIRIIDSKSKVSVK